ncbi:hypothetical protein A2U01_0063726, partial [Trifolium medium]|nr:hypothetical protein [Trifolium medium]
INTPARRADHLRALANNRRKIRNNRATLRVAPALAARRADTRRKSALEPRHCASRQPSCAPRKGHKPNRLSQQEWRVAPHASARRARGRT